MFNFRSIARFAILTPIIVILLTIGWYQQAIEHSNIPETTLPIDEPSGSQPTESFVIAGYFINWGIYDRKYHVVDIQAKKLSHVLYAFANVNTDGTILLGTIDGKLDPWKENDQDLHGNFKQLNLLKQQNRHLKVSLSIGGYSWSGNFSNVAASPKSRATFTKTAISHLQNLGLDGIDIDWEFPKDSNDAENYVLLLKELRNALDEYQQKIDPTEEPFLLSVAMPCGPENYRILKLADMAKYVDLFYLMAYDFAGEWDQQTGHQSNLFGGSLNVNQAIDDYEKAGVPSKKLVMGMPAYGRGFSNTSPKPGSSYQGVPDGSWDRGSYDYKNLPQEGAEEYLDETNIASWSYNKHTKEFVTYDTPDVVRAKSEYIKKRHLGGGMFWELTADVPGDDPRSLVHTVYQVLGNQLDRSPNHIAFPLSHYNNIPHA
ncbi:Endochitinase B [Choanephora cucurbitarum]|uniref:Endochitinase B n=1 Tax=Choanephora cucurbitarum TaxID=101091 RepID=A0A1C7N3K7_9FUNG|nr:Endochitinase B [Choanephora cucurbitarum]